MCVCHTIIKGYLLTYLFVHSEDPQRLSVLVLTLTLTLTLTLSLEIKFAGVQNAETQLVT